MADVSDPGKVALCGLASVILEGDTAKAVGVAVREAEIARLEARVAELEARTSRGYVTTSAPIARSLSDTIVSQAARIKELEDQLRVAKGGK